LACDVTGDGRVSSLDAARIHQYLAGRIQRFTVGMTCGSDWRFIPASGAPGAVPPIIQNGTCVPASLQFAPLASSISNADFDAAVFGDCAL
jgi:hypothetical protein